MSSECIIIMFNNGVYKITFLVFVCVSLYTVSVDYPYKHVFLIQSLCGAVYVCVCVRIPVRDLGLESGEGNRASV